MTIPGFAAESVFSGGYDTYRPAQHSSPLGETSLAPLRVVPALPPREGDRPADRIADCIESCRESGLSATECARRCRPVSTPYQCTPQDNSVNHYLCLGGNYAWEGACMAECSLLKAVPFVGEVLAGACASGCHALGENLRATCPPATICV